MEALKKAVKKQLQKYSLFNNSLRRVDVKPFADLSGRQRRKARKQVRREAKEKLAKQ